MIDARALLVKVLNTFPLLVRRNVSYLQRGRKRMCLEGGLRVPALGKLVHDCSLHI